MSSAFNPSLAAHCKCTHIHIVSIRGVTIKSRFETYLVCEVTVRFIFGTVWEQNAKHKFVCCVFRTFVNKQFIVTYKIEYFCKVLPGNKLIHSQINKIK